MLEKDNLIEKYSVQIMISLMKGNGLKAKHLILIQGKKADEKQTH